MNPIQKAIADVKFKIPLEILTAAFIHREFGKRPLPLTVDAMIRQKVIDERVRLDCDLVGGTEIAVPLTGVVPEYIDPYTVVYRIPKNLTQNRTISRVLSLGLGTGLAQNMLNSSYNGYSPMLNAAQGVMSAMLPIPIVSTANIRLIAENTILVTENISLPANTFLRCYVENDTDFSQLRSTTYHKFTKLVELATKAYIYNTLTISIGQAQLSGGQELGRFREIVDGYADANELYETFLQEEWRKVAIMDDAMSRERHLRIIVGGNR